MRINVLGSQASDPSGYFAPTERGLQDLLYSSNSSRAVYPSKLVPENLCRPWTRYFPHRGAGVEGSPSLMLHVQPQAWPSCSAESAVQERSATWTGKGGGRRRRVLSRVLRVGEALSVSLMGPGRSLPSERRGGLS